MDANPRLLALTRALADPLRLAVLHRLMTGPATVSELMAVVGAEQSRLSNHLALLRERRRARTTRQGRHVIYELDDAAVGTLVEALGQIGGAAPRTVKSVAIAHARTCYDHLAGRLGVAMFKALVDRRAVKHQKDVPGDVELGPQATPVFETLGMDLDVVTREHTRFATACLDWAERQRDLGGVLAADLWYFRDESG